MADVSSLATPDNFQRFLANLPELNGSVESLSGLAKHEKVDGRGSWTEEESERELLYWLQVFLTHLGCPMEYVIPCARQMVAEVFDGSFRREDFKATPPQLTDIAGNGFPSGENGDAAGDGHNETSAESENGAPVLSAKDLYGHAVAKASELLTRWKVEPPHLEPMHVPHDVSYHSVKNKRPTMEDRHVIIPDLRSLMDLKGIASPVSFYAVYDGHAGSVAATYAAAHLHRWLCSSKHFPHRMDEALKEAFVMTDENYSEKGTRDRDYSGTTAVVCVVFESSIYIAWVGDSEAAIVRDGLVEKLVEPKHIASNELERDRIEQAGGVVIKNGGGWRVGAVLTVTRAIGDTGFKPYLSADPDVRIVRLEGGEEYLILACDGLWDELTELQAMQETNRFLINNPAAYKEVAKTLADKARRSGSQDNITVIIVYLKPVETIISRLREHPESVTVETEIQRRDSEQSGPVEGVVEQSELMDFTQEASAVNPFETESNNPFDSSLAPTEDSYKFPDTSSGRTSEPSDWEFLTENQSAAAANAPTATVDDRTPLLADEQHDPQDAMDVLDRVIGDADLGLPSATPGGEQLINLEELQYSSERSGAESANINFDESNLDASLVENDEFVYIGGAQAEESLQAAVGSGQDQEAEPLLQPDSGVPHEASQAGGAAVPIDNTIADQSSTRPASENSNIERLKDMDISQESAEDTSALQKSEPILQPEVVSAAAQPVSLAPVQTGKSPAQQPLTKKTKDTPQLKAKTTSANSTPPVKTSAPKPTGSTATKTPVTAAKATANHTPVNRPASAKAAPKAPVRTSVTSSATPTGPAKKLDSVSEQTPKPSPVPRSSLPAAARLASAKPHKPTATPTATPSTGTTVKSANPTPRPAPKPAAARPTVSSAKLDTSKKLTHSPVKADALGTGDKPVPSAANVKMPSKVPATVSNGLSTPAKPKVVGQPARMPSKAAPSVQKTASSIEKTATQTDKASQSGAAVKSQTRPATSSTSAVPRRSATSSMTRGPKATTSTTNARPTAAAPTKHVATPRPATKVAPRMGPTKATTKEQTSTKSGAVRPNTEKDATGDSSPKVNGGGVSAVDKPAEKPLVNGSNGEERRADNVDNHPVGSKNL